MLKSSDPDDTSHRRRNLKAFGLDCFSIVDRKHKQKAAQRFEPQDKYLQIASTIIPFCSGLFRARCRASPESVIASIRTNASIIKINSRAAIGTGGLGEVCINGDARLQLIVR